MNLHLLTDKNRDSTLFPLKLDKNKKNRQDVSEAFMWRKNTVTTPARHVSSFVFRSQTSLGSTRWADRQKDTFLIISLSLSPFLSLYLFALVLYIRLRCMLTCTYRLMLTYVYVACFCFCWCCSTIWYLYISSPPGAIQAASLWPGSRLAPRRCLSIAYSVCISALARTCMLSQHVFRSPFDFCRSAPTLRPQTVL